MVQTTSTQQAALIELLKRDLLSVFQPKLAVHPLAKPTKLKKSMGKTVRWRMFNRISGDTTPLQEGVNPAASNYSSVNVETTVRQFGDYFEISDLLEYTSYHDEYKEVAELCGEAAAETVEDLCITELDAELTELFANGRGSANDVEVTDIVVMKDFLKGKANLKAAYVPPHEKFGKFVSVLHPATEYDLQTETNMGGWLDIQSYPTADKRNIQEHEIGQLLGIRFLYADKMTDELNSGSVSLKSNYLLGKEVFGSVALDKSMFDIIIKDDKSGGVSNPLEMFGTVGWKIKGYATLCFAGGRGRRIRGASSL